MIAGLSQRSRQSSGFTIVELLIVIVVIGILAAIVIVAYNGVQQRARDSQRTTAVASIQKALELYKIDNGQYPAVCSGGDNSGCSVSDMANALSLYARQIPQDPQYPTKTISYVRGTAASDSYGLYVLYETKAVCKTGNNLNSGWWGTGVPSC